MSPAPTVPPDPLADGPLGQLPAGLVLGVDHVGLATADLDGVIAFYTGRLGLREVHREYNAEQGVVEAMLVAGPVGPIDSSRTDAPAPAGPVVTRLQVLAPTAADSPVARFLDRSGPGLQHLAFRVSDLDRTVSRLRAAGIRPLYPRPGRGTAGSLINFLHPRDTGGVLVELVRPAVEDTHAEPGIADAGQ